MTPSTQKYHVLTCNSHEAYVSMLANLDIHLDIIDGLSGRYTSQWDTHIRPIPGNVKLLRENQLQNSAEPYDCFIGHSIDDLLLVKQLHVPKILVLHVSLYGYLAQENSKLSPREIQLVLQTYINKINASVVAISELKLRSWGASGRIIPPFIDTDLFSGYRGEVIRGLRVVNHFTAKRKILYGSLHDALTESNPIDLLGVNPDISGYHPSNGLEDLVENYRSHRYYVHTAMPEYEDGYNLASLEAMAVGMPVISNAHPTSPIISGLSGYASNDLQVLKKGIQTLIHDQELAVYQGQQGRRYVQENHTRQQFTANWMQAIKDASQRYYS